MTAEWKTLYTAWTAAEQAWLALVALTFPGKPAGDVAYTNEGKGEPGTELRAAYDAFVSAGSVWFEARDSDLVLIDI